MPGLLYKPRSANLDVWEASCCRRKRVFLVTLMIGTDRLIPVANRGVLKALAG